ncbi:hypothetical protein BD779DRAFT_1781759 [Infundibulicybe gibba]|nr:hypothetical protein BD779DRAFT_1781759 [Infundibulicybe gibba]
MHRELMQEIDRYPIVERALADVHAFSDPEFIDSVRGSAERILRGDKGPKSQTWPRKENGDEWNQQGASGPTKPPDVNITIRRATPVKTLEDDNTSIPQPHSAAVQPPTLPASTPPPDVVLETSVSAAEAGVSRKMDTPATILSDTTPKQISTVATIDRGEVPDVDMANETKTERNVENTLHD